MKEAKIVLAGGENTQMKTIAMLIQKASSYQSSIYICKDTKRANAKSLLGVLSLDLTPGTEVLIRAEGPDEDAAISDLQAWIVNPVLHQA